ncbi:MAG: ribosome maturation factor RimM [Rubrobacteraceae bacterium]
MEELSDPVVIGVVGGPHGVRGTVRVKAAGPGRHLREGLEPVVDGKRYRILRSRPTPKGFLVDLEGVRDRSETTALRGKELVLDRQELDDLEKDEFYVGDLVGMEAYDERDENLGAVVEVIPTPAHDLLVIEASGGQRYVPFTLEYVPELDLVTGRLVIRPPGA